jgi:hypothetical protein
LRRCAIMHGIMAIPSSIPSLTPSSHLPPFITLPVFPVQCTLQVMQLYVMFLRCMFLMLSHNRVRMCSPQLQTFVISRTPPMVTTAAIVHEIHDDNVDPCEQTRARRFKGCRRLTDRPKACSSMCASPSAEQAEPGVAFHEFQDRMDLHVSIICSL